MLLGLLFPCLLHILVNYFARQLFEWLGYADWDDFRNRHELRISLVALCFLICTTYLSVVHCEDAKNNILKNVGVCEDETIQLTTDVTMVVSRLVVAFLSFSAATTHRLETFGKIMATSVIGILNYVLNYVGHFNQFIFELKLISWWSLSLITSSAVITSWLLKTAIGQRDIALQAEQTAIVQRDEKEAELRLVIELLTSSTPIDRKDEDGKTVLHKAAENGDDKKVAVLIKCNANVNVTNKDGHSPLSYAVMYGYDKCLELLLAAGADKNKSSKRGHTPLSYAAMYGKDKCLEMLLAAGADQNKIDNNGKVPLYHARRNGHHGCARLLEGAASSSSN